MTPKLLGKPIIKQKICEDKKNSHYSFCIENTFKINLKRIGFSVQILWNSYNLWESEPKIQSSSISLNNIVHENWMLVSKIKTSLKNWWLDCVQNKSFKITVKFSFKILSNRSSSKILLQLYFSSEQQPKTQPPSPEVQVFIPGLFLIPTKSESSGRFDNWTESKWLSKILNLTERIQTKNRQLVITSEMNPVEEVFRTVFKVQK